MTEVSSSSASSDRPDPSRSNETAARKPGKLGGMVSMFEKRAEEKQQPPPSQTRSASNSLCSPPIAPVQHSASTSSPTSPAAPRVGASIADRMAAMKNLTMAAPAPSSAASSHALPGKLSAGAKTLPLSFDQPAASSSSAASSGVPPRPNKLALGGLGGALNAALANGLKAGFAPGGGRSPSASIAKREDSKTAETETTDALLHTAPAALSSSSDDSAAAAASGASELTHAKRAKRAVRTKAVLRPAAGTLRFKAFSDVSKAADMKATVTIVGGEGTTEHTDDAAVVKEATSVAVEVEEQREVPTVADKQSAALAPIAAPLSTDLSVASEAVPVSVAAVEAVIAVPVTVAEATDSAAQTKPAEVLAAEATADAPATPIAVALATTAASAPLNTSSASIHSEDSLDTSFSSVASSASAASLDSSFAGEQLSVYNAAADYFFQDPATLGYNPALHAAYSTRLHTGATFHRWQPAGSSAKRLLYLSDCAAYLCLLDSKRRLGLERVEAKRRLPVKELCEVVKGKVAGDAVWDRSACKEVLGGRCLMLRTAAAAGGAGGGGDGLVDGMLSVMHLEALTGVQRDEWEEALRWLIATKGAGSPDTTGSQQLAGS